MLGSKNAFRSDYKPSLSLSNTDTEQVKGVKLHGVTIDKTLSWTSHIGNIVMRMRTGIPLLKKC